jgi:hypothetical protein
MIKRLADLQVFQHLVQTDTHFRLFETTGYACSVESDLKNHREVLLVHDDGSEPALQKNGRWVCGAF